MPALFEVDRAELEELLPRALAGTGLLSGYERLGGGTYNTGALARLTDGREVVVKISPPSWAPGLSYEKGLLTTEADYFERAGALGAPVPRVLASGSAVFEGREHLVLSRIPGAPLYETPYREQGAERAAIRRELGAAVALAHRAPCRGFGYTGGRAHLSAGNWPDAFGAMMGALLEDAARYDVQLPVPATRVMALVAACRGSLAEVTRPVLAHFDLWDGNILVHEQPGQAPSLSGLIDAERALHGDPVLELPSLSVLDARAEDPGFVADDDFLSGYSQVAGPLPVDSALLERLALYRAYLYQIMLVEAVPRRLTGEDAEWRRTVCASMVSRHLGFVAARAR